MFKQVLDSDSSMDSEIAACRHLTNMTTANSAGNGHNPKHHYHHHHCSTQESRHTTAHIIAH